MRSRFGPGPTKKPEKISGRNRAATGCPPTAALRDPHVGPPGALKVGTPVQRPASWHFTVRLDSEERWIKRPRRSTEAAAGLFSGEDRRLRVRQSTLDALVGGAAQDIGEEDLIRHTAISLTCRVSGDVWMGTRDVDL